MQPNLLLRLGLLDAIGMVRLRGLTAIENRIRQAVLQAAGTVNRQVSDSSSESHCE